MIKIVPLIVSLISVFSTGAMPLDDVGKELIEQDNKQIVMVAEKPDSNAADRPFIKEPRHKASTAELKKSDEADKNYAEVEILPSDNEKTVKKEEPANNASDKKTVTVKNSSDSVSKQNNGDTSKKKTIVYDETTFEYRKAELDKQFEKMFQLKERLDEINKESDQLWREYYAMRESYDKRFKRLIAEWANDSLEVR